MTTRKAGLGRNLNALLGDSMQAVKKQAPTEASGLRTLAIEKLQPGIYQPRQMMDDVALQELADSIKAQGIIQPIVVRPVANNQYEIIAGERRWRAAQRAELAEVPVIVREIDDEATIAMALIENIQREDLNPIEEARALERLQNEFGLTHEEVAGAVGKSRTTVTNLLRLMNLQHEVKMFLEKGALEMGHARALLGLDGNQQVTLARQVVSKKLTVRETERLVRLALQPTKVSQATSKQDADVKLLQNDLSEKLGAKVQIEQMNNGRGKLVIHYHSIDALDGILSHIK